MSASSINNKVEEKWNFRTTTQRLIVVKTKAAGALRVAAIDVATNLPFALNIPKEFTLGALQENKLYLASIKIYTSKDLQDIEPEIINFFEVLDVDQKAEDYIKAYWAYPKKIRFEIVEAEEQ